MYCVNFCDRLRGKFRNNRRVTRLRRTATPGRQRMSPIQRWLLRQKEKKTAKAPFGSGEREPLSSLLPSISRRNTIGGAIANTPGRVLPADGETISRHAVKRDHCLRTPAFGRCGSRPTGGSRNKLNQSVSDFLSRRWCR
jgi:hypothetical protein